MSYKNLKKVTIVAVIFGVIGFGYGVRTWIQTTGEHPSRTQANYVEEDIMNKLGAAAESFVYCTDKPNDPKCQPIAPVSLQSFTTFSLTPDQLLTIIGIGGCRQKYPGEGWLYNQCLGVVRDCLNGDERACGRIRKALQDSGVQITAK